MKKMFVLLFALIAMFSFSTQASATQYINDYLYFSPSGIINDSDSNTDAILSYKGSSVNMIEFTTTTADTLQWYQSFTAPTDFNLANVLSAKFYVYLSDDNDNNSEYGWFWSEKDTTWRYIDANDIDNGYYSFDVNLSALNDLGAYAAISNTTNFNSLQSDFSVALSILSVEYTPVPEPATFVLLGCGIFAVFSFQRRKSAKI